MRKQITASINNKNYPIIYTKSGDTYTVEINHEDLKPHVTDRFTFHIKNGGANYIVISNKTHEIASQIIKQINSNELK